MYNIDVYTAAIVCLTTILLVKIYFKYANKFCKSQKRLDGKTCVVTGGTNGMGLEIAKEFARRGAKVIVACPFEKEGTNAQDTIVRETGNDNVIFKYLDLASLESTRKFAKEILNQEKRLDILINNAGMGASKKITADNLNITMQTNYYGHFLLTVLLLPLLKKTGSSTEKSRIVNMTSLYHYIGSLEPDNMNRRNYWSLYKYYANSKLCLMLFSTELTKRLKGQNIVINSVDPGAVGTGIFKKNFGEYLGSGLEIILNALVKTPWEGAQTALHVALSEDLGDISGAYYRNCRLRNAKKISYNREAAKIMWDISVRSVKLNDCDLDD